jgi:hypothetical protein
MPRNSRKKFDYAISLNDHCEMVSSQTLLTEPFPQSNYAFGMVIQHENLNSLDNLDDQVFVAANLAKKCYGKNNFPKIDKMCTYCHKNNHIVDNCFRKHGIPSGYRFKDGIVVGSKNKEKLVLTVLIMMIVMFRALWIIV